MADRGRLRRLIERILPWYDVAQATRLHERTVAIGVQSAAARDLAQQTRNDVLRASYDRGQRRLQSR